YIFLIIFLLPSSLHLLSLIEQRFPLNQGWPYILGGGIISGLGLFALIWRSIFPVSWHVWRLKSKDSEVRESAARILDNLNWEPQTLREKISYLIAKEEWNELLKIGIPISNLIKKLIEKDMPIYVMINQTIPLIRNELDRYISSKDQIETWKEIINLGIRLAEQNIPPCDTLMWGVPFVLKITGEDKEKFKVNLQRLQIAAEEWDYFVRSQSIQWKNDSAPHVCYREYVEKVIYPILTFSLGSNGEFKDVISKCLSLIDIKRIHITTKRKVEREVKKYVEGGDYSTWMCPGYGGGYYQTEVIREKITEVINYDYLDFTSASKFANNSKKIRQYLKKIKSSGQISSALTKQKEKLDGGVFNFIKMPQNREVAENLAYRIEKILLEEERIREFFHNQFVEKDIIYLSDIWGLSLLTFGGMAEFRGRLFPVILRKIAILINYFKKRRFFSAYPALYKWEGEEKKPEIYSFIPDVKIGRGGHPIYKIPQSPYSLKDIIFYKGQFSPEGKGVISLSALLKELEFPLRNKPTSEFIAPLNKEISGVIVEDKRGNVEVRPTPFTEQHILIDKEGRPIEIWSSEGKIIRREIGEALPKVANKPSTILMRKLPFDKLIKQMKKAKDFPIARYRSHPLDNKYLLHFAHSPLISIPEIAFDPQGKRFRIFIFIQKYPCREIELTEEFSELWLEEKIATGENLLEMVKDKGFLEKKEEIIDKFFFTKEVTFDGGLIKDKIIKRIERSISVEEVDIEVGKKWLSKCINKDGGYTLKDFEEPDLSQNIQNLLREKQKLTELNNLFARLKTTSPQEKESINKAIKRIIDEINAYPESLDQIQKADLYYTEDLLEENYLKKAEELILEGKVAIELFAAGAATRLLR
ncbi:MAG: hypothetical protein DRP81_09415, partial [Candidatus Omnitrophota bacterium]